jgi:hypothetical protein
LVWWWEASHFLVSRAIPQMHWHTHHIFAPWATLIVYSSCICTMSNLSWCPSLPFLECVETEVMILVKNNQRWLNARSQRSSIPSLHFCHFLNECAETELMTLVKNKQRWLNASTQHRSTNALCIMQEANWKIYYPWQELCYFHSIWIIVSLSELNCEDGHPRQFQKFW